MSAKKVDESNNTRPPLIIFDPADGRVHAGTFDAASVKLARKLARRFKCHIANGDDAAMSELAGRLMPGRIEDDKLLLALVPDDVADQLRSLLETAPEPNETSQTGEPSETLAALSSDLQQAEADGLSPIDESYVSQEPGETSVAETASGDQATNSDATIVMSTAGSSETSEASPSLSVWDRLNVGDLVLAADLDKKGEPDSWYEAVIVRVTPASYILRFRDYPQDGLLARTRRHIALLHPAP